MERVMPEHAKAEVIIRQWEMLRLVPPHDQPGRSAPEFAAALESRGYRVTRRTVERDLEALARCLPLQSDPLTRPARWRWQKNRRLDIPGMEVAEAMALFMMRNAIEAHLPSCLGDAIRSRFVEADKVLATLARAGGVRWSDRVRIVPSNQVLQPPRVSARIVQTLQQALLRDVAVDASYQSLSDPAPRRRILYPRALLLRGSALYLVADQKGSGDPPHHYALQRFTSVRLLELEPWPNAPFSLDAFMAEGTNQFGAGVEIRLKAMVSPPLYRILRDTPLSADMTLVERGSAWVLTATVRDTWALHSWLLGHGENIRVLQPAALRALIARRTAAAVAQYR
jgi:predicted DNA-binding transcriptional regulator YafY